MQLGEGLVLVVVVGGDGGGGLGGGAGVADVGVGRGGGRGVLGRLRHSEHLVAVVYMSLHGKIIYSQVII